MLALLALRHRAVSLQPAAAVTVSRLRPLRLRSASEEAPPNPPNPLTLSPCLPVPPLSSPSLCGGDSDAAPGRRPAVRRTECGRKRAVECPAAEYGCGRGGCHVFVRMRCRAAPERWPGVQAGGRGGNPRPGGVSAASPLRRPGSSGVPLAGARRSPSHESESVCVASRVTGNSGPSDLTVTIAAAFARQVATQGPLDLGDLGSRSRVRLGHVAAT